MLKKQSKVQVEVRAPVRKCQRTGAVLTLTGNDEPILTLADVLVVKASGYRGRMAKLIVEALSKSPHSDDPKLRIPAGSVLAADRNNLCVCARVCARVRAGGRCARRPAPTRAHPPLRAHNPRPRRR